MINKIIVMSLVVVSMLSADVEDNVDEIVYIPNIEDNVISYENEFYKTKIGKTVKDMDNRHKRIKKLEASINNKVKEFYEIYEIAKGYTDKSECSMVEEAIKTLKGEFESLSSLNKKINKKNIDINGLQSMIINLKQKKQQLCKGQ
jgi:hypothetical protein